MNIDYMNQALRKMIMELDEYLDSAPQNYRRMVIDLGFSRGKIPDYKNKGLSTLYLLKMSWQYNFEYWVILRVALRMLKERGIDFAYVYSFGCGGEIDALSLSFAIASDYPEDMRASYTGVDAVRWGAVYPRPKEIAAGTYGPFLQKDLAGFWDSMDRFDGNILFFPKVLSELDELADVAGAFARGLSKAKLTQDRILLCISYKGKHTFTRSSVEPDWDKAQKIIEALRLQGYTCSKNFAPAPLGMESFFTTDMVESESGEPFPYYYFEHNEPGEPRQEEPDLKICDVSPVFAPPEDILEYLESPGFIRRHCQYFSAREDKYFKKYPEARWGSPDPLKVCTEACTINCYVHPYDSINTQFRTMCFQVLEFTR